MKKNILFQPKLLSIKNTIVFGGKKEIFKMIFFLTLGLVFSIGIYLIFYRILLYFYRVEFIGNLLIVKLFSLLLLTFFSFTYFSNIITSLSTFYISSDLNLLISAPLPYGKIINQKFRETFFQSSWMIIFICFPIFLSLGSVFKASGLFYLIIFFSVIPFLIISTSLGILTMGFLVKIFSVRHTKGIMLFLGLFFGIGFYLFMRFLKPEQFVDPDRFLTLANYLVSLKATEAIFSPSTWLLKILSFLINEDTNKKEIIFYFLMLWSNAFFFFLLVQDIMSYLFFNSWSNAQEGKERKISLGLFSKIKNPIIRKDILIFFRDSTQWSQLFLILSLVVVYIYNFSVLPLEKSPLPTLYLRNLLSFLNLGLSGFVLASLSVRFAFPSVSYEREALRLIKASPWDLKKFLWSKFWFSFIPLVFLAVVLTYTTNRLLKVEQFMMYLSMCTIFFLTLGMASLGVSLGAVYPQLRFENKSSISTGFGGLVCMLISISVIAVVVSLEAWSVYWIFWSKLLNYNLSRMMMIEIYLSFLVAFVICFTAFILPLKLGYDKFSQLEF